MKDCGKRRRKGKSHAVDNQRIAIIGAGTAGLALATFLARQGHRPTVIEKAPALAPVGAGLLLQPSGIDVLAELGCLEPLEAYGRRVEALYGTTCSGRAVMQVRYTHLGTREALFGLGVHRAALCRVLDDALAGEDHERWFGCDVTGLTQREDAAVVGFRDGDDEATAAFDAVVVANGAASQLRPASLVRYDRQYPWGAMWLIRPIPRELEEFNAPRLQQRYRGASVMLGVLPTGSSPQAPETPLMSLFWSLPVSEMAAWRTGGVDLDGWKKQVTAVWPELEPLVRRIELPSELLPATYRDVIMKRWGTGRLGFIGDAAHAMSPQLGQGANMALLDASALAAAIKTSNDWETTWAQFARKRRGSIRFYQRMSRLLTPFFQSRIPGAALVRDYSFPIAHKVPWLRRQMAATIAGGKQGWFDD